MSLSEPSNGVNGSPPRARHTDPYPKQGSEHVRMQLPPPPSLPPMSSLLPRQMAEAQHSIPPPPSQPPSYGETRPHPLWLSQMDPSAPVQHIYHPPQPTEGSHAQQYRSEPLLVPMRHDSLLTPIDHDAPLAQRRQSRKIVQRRADFPKDRVHADSTPALSQVRFNEPDKSLRSREQEESLCNRQDAAQIEPLFPGSQETQSSRSMPISGLLSASPSEPERPIPPFKLVLRQQPIAARACGFGERDRRVVDPPPILQLSIDDPNASPEEISAKIRELLCSVVHCTLWNPDTDSDESAMPGASDKRQQRRLMGTLVSSPFVGLDEFDVEGCFFTFPDLSVRTPGMYSLKFSLAILDRRKMGPGSKVPIRAIVKSNTFHVYNAKDFGGMRPSSELTKRLKHQGCLIQVKKGNAKTNGSHPRDEDDEDDDDDDEDDGEMTAAKRGKRPKR